MLQKWSTRIENQYARKGRVWRTRQSGAIPSSMFSADNGSYRPAHRDRQKLHHRNSRNGPCFLLFVHPRFLREWIPVAVFVFLGGTWCISFREGSLSGDPRSPSRYSIRAQIANRYSRSDIFRPLAYKPTHKIPFRCRHRCHLP